MALAMELNRPHGYAFARVGSRELHIERHAEAASEGWLSVQRTSFEGEVVVNVGRWAVHFVRHR